MTYRIMFVVGQLSIGGTEKQLLELVKRLDRSRFTSRVVALYDGPLARNFKQAKIEVYLVDRRQKGRLASLYHLAYTMRDWQPHLVHAFGYAARGAIPTARMFTSARTVVSLRSDPLKSVSLLDRIVDSFVDLLLTNSYAAANVARRFWPRVQVATLHNGIYLGVFDSVTQFNLTYSNTRLWPVICAVARLSPPKNHHMLLKAFAKVHQQRPQVLLWLVGDGPLRRELEYQAQHLGISDVVEFWGTRQDVPTLLRNCYCGVLSSQYEGLPNVLLEYMAAKLPVVATNVGGIPEVVVHGETGLLVPPNDPDALAEALLYLLDHPEAARRMGEAGRKRVEEKFTVERMVQETERIYLELLGG